MGRKRTQLALSAAERAGALRMLTNAHDPRKAERLRFALLAAVGRHTLEELAQRIGRRRSTIQNWLSSFRTGGLEKLLARRGGPGRSTLMARTSVQRQLVAGFKAGRWSSAAEVSTWLWQVHGIRRSRKSIYYWFRKHGMPAPSAQP